VIIQRRDTSLVLITQPDHAALSAGIMQHWRDGGLHSHPRRESILLAVREHDNGWEPVDRRPILDSSTGGLLDFMDAPADVRQTIWPRAVDRLADDPWAAALVARHALHIYRRYRQEAQWHGFFADLEAKRDAHLRRVDSLTLEDLQGDYFFVRMGDLLSLTFCNGWSEGPERPGYGMRLEEDRLVVTPDPFGGGVVRLAVRARELPNRRFRSEADAAREFEAASIFSLTGVFAGGG
jgi:hypothetical protein